MRGAIILVVLFLAIQLIPFGHAHSNPPVTQEPHWNSPQTRALVVAACYDCHSNQTTWPWYSNIAPVSWLTQADVNIGRQRLNFSTWNQHPVSTERIVRSIQRGSMPPFWYTPMHPNARLTPAQQQTLVRGIEASLGATHASGR